MLTISDVLRDKRGFATVFVLCFMALIIMFGIGVGIVNYASQSTLVAQTKNMTAAIESRANQIAAELNTSAENDKGATAAELMNGIRADAIGDPRTALTTKVTNQEDVAGDIVLTMEAYSDSGRFQIERTVTLTPITATHVTGRDEAGNYIWADSAEGDKLTLWSFAEGSIKPIKIEEHTAPSADTKWSAVDDRAGIDSKGHLWTWGANTDGQAGVGTTADVDEPTAVLPAKTWRDVTTDATSTFAVDNTGALYAWGANTDSKLGTASASSVPIRSGLVNSVQDIASSDNSTFAVDSRGRLYAWGNNAAGRLGTGSTAPSFAAAERVKPDLTFRSVTTDGGSTYAIDTAGNLWVWGVNDAGQLGTGVVSAPVTSPVQIATGTRFSSISAGGKSVAAIDDTSKLWAWGAAGRAGDGSDSARTAPVRADSPETFTSVSAGATTSYAISGSGKIHTWGENSEGQAGEGATESILTPTLTLAGASFRSVNAGTSGAETSAVDNRGGLWAFAHGGDGLWKIDFSSDPTAALKMPLPDSFTGSRN